MNLEWCDAIIFLVSRLENPMELIILSAIAAVVVFAVELYDYAF
jgi:hypothetical protein